MNRKQILDDAANAVLRDRASIHGKPENSFGDIAKLWSVFLDRKIEPWQVAIMMGLLKVARAKANPTNEDNLIDLCGYAACAGELAKPDGPIVNASINDEFIDKPWPLLGRHPNMIIVHFGNIEEGTVVCEDDEDIKKNGIIPYHLHIGGVEFLEDAREKGYEFLKSKSVLVNV